jgi:4-hydroxy-tetrahydrodipicolinate synthase
MAESDFLRGAYCPLIVPFRDGKIDFDTYGRLIERQIAEGTHGLLVNATSGEPTVLSVEERGQLVEFAVKTANGRRPVCAGTASESLEATAALIDRFDKAGADAVLVVTPYYSVPPQRGAAAYFARLGERKSRPRRASAPVTKPTSVSVFFKPAKCGTASLIAASVSTTSAKPARPGM